MIQAVVVGSAGVDLVARQFTGAEEGR
jgi:hypothetical protein